MKITFKFQVLDIPLAKVGHRIRFAPNIGEYCPGLKNWAGKIYNIIDEDPGLNLFKMSRGDIWISRQVIDSRYSKLISKYKQL